MKKSLGSFMAIGLLVASQQPAFAQPAGGFPGGGFPGMDGASAATEVGYVTLQPETVPLTTTLPGRVAASAEAEIRPQVGGIIRSVDVQEGQAVAAGDLLFTVDDTNYRAEVASAEASLASANAAVPTAQAKVTRYETLVNSAGVSQAELDTARAELAQAEASVQSAEAQLELQQITLEQTQIKSQISGIVGTISVGIGSLVTAGQSDALTTIRAIDPVFVDLVESSSNILELRQSLAAANGEAVGAEGGATTEPPPDQPPATQVNFTLEDGSLFDQDGTLSNADSVVSESTGTVTMRASVPNPARLLLPGMFVRAHIAVGEQENAFLVPQRAVSFDSQGNPNAYFVTADNKAEKRVLTATRDMNNSWVVTAGVSAGDRLIVDGLQKISEGTSVTPVEVTISEDGVVYQEISDDDASASAPAGGAPSGGPPSGAPSGAPPSGFTPPSDGQPPSLPSGGTPLPEASAPAASASQTEGTTP